MKVAPFMLLAIGLAAACNDQRTPTAPIGAVSANRAGSSCPFRADVIVSDESSLNTALSTAHTGEVIGVSGFFGVTGDVYVRTRGVVLTCATRGGGIYATGAVPEMLRVEAPDVIVDHLRLDATLAANAFFAFNNDTDAFAQNVRFTNNSVTCGTDACVLFDGGTGAVVTDNVLTAAGAPSGIHVQAYYGISADGAHIERNTITAVSPSGISLFGAIRPVILSDVVIANNVISGPWSNGISARTLSNSLIQGNQISGVTGYGIQLGRGGLLTYSTGAVVNNIFKSNRVSASGIAGIWLRVACSNQFANNNLTGNAGNLGMVFTDTTGANVVTGSDDYRYGVIDAGAFDCNGDGVNDPNVIRIKAAASTSASAVPSGNLFAPLLQASANGGPARGTPNEKSLTRLLR